MADSGHQMPLTTSHSVGAEPTMLVAMLEHHVSTSSFHITLT